MVTSLLNDCELRCSDEAESGTVLAGESAVGSTHEPLKMPAHVVPVRVFDVVIAVAHDRSIAACKTQ